MQIEQLITGCVGIIIGILVIWRRDALVNQTLHSEKRIDSNLNEDKNDYNHIGVTIIPKLVVIVIGVGLIFVGILTLLT